MQCYVKSAGKGYDQDYTWLQVFGQDEERTCVLRQLGAHLSIKTPSLAVLHPDNNYYLLFGGLKTGKVDIVGTPIYDTFAFVCPFEEEQNIRYLAAGILSGNASLRQLLSSVICEDNHSDLGFSVSDNFDDTLENWLKSEGANAVEAFADEIKTCKSVFLQNLPNDLFIGFLQSGLFAWEQNNILLINSDKENSSDFYMFSIYKIDFESIYHDKFCSKIFKNDVEQKSQNDEETMNIPNVIDTPLEDTDETESLKIFLFTATKNYADYHFWNNSEPEWAENIKEKLFPLEIPKPGLNFYIAIEQTADSHHIWLQDDMQKITDGIKNGRRMKVALLFEVSRKIKERTQENIECGIRNICATWTDVDSDFGNKLLREIIERKALIINDAFFEVNEAEIKKILGEFFNKGNSLESNPCQQEVCHIAKDWSGFAEAKRWFGEKLRTTCFAYDNSLLCYFTPCEVTEPEKVSYCARWSRESETVIPKANVPDMQNIVEGETTSAEMSNQQKVNSANEPRTTTGQTSTTSSTCNTARQSPRTQPVHRKKKQNNYLFIGIIILIFLLIVMIKSCSGSAGPKKEESLSPTKVEQSSAREGNVSKVNKKSLSPKDNNNQK